MNNWRLLLFAVVAVIQPIGSFTETNLIDGRQCCDHRSNSFTEDTRVYGNSRKNNPEDHRLSSQEIRTDRRSDANVPIRTTERLNLESSIRRVSPAARFSTESRVAREQERRQRTVEAGDSRREHQIRRIRHDASRDSLKRHERDGLDSRRASISFDNTRIARLGNNRVSREYLDNENVRDVKSFRRISVNRESLTVLRRNDDVAGNRNRVSRMIRSRVEIRYDNNRKQRLLDERVRESRENNIERDNRQSAKRVGDRRQREQNRESRDRIINLRDSSERNFADRRRESRDAFERVDRSSEDIRRYRTDNRIAAQRQQRDESRLSRERSLERRESRLSSERRLSVSRESRALEVDARSPMISSNDYRTDQRREASRDMLRASQESSKERRQISRDVMSQISPRILRTLNNDETRDKREQLSARSVDRIRSNEREITSRASETNVRNERVPMRLRDTRSEERLDERRNQRSERITFRDRETKLRQSRHSAEPRREIRSTSRSRLDVNGHSERKPNLKEHDDLRSDINRVREERRASREHMDNGIRRDYRIRERSDIQREAFNDGKARTFVIQQSTRFDSTAQRRFDTRTMSRTEFTRRQRATYENVRDLSRDANSDDSRSRDIVSSRLSRDSIERRDTPLETRDSRVDARNEITRRREVRMTRVESRRQQDPSQDRVLQRQARDILAARSAERRFRETEARNEIRLEHLERSREVRLITEREVRNDAQEFRTVESRRDSSRLSGRDEVDRRNLALEHMIRSANRDVRREAKVRSESVLAKDTNVRDVRFRRFDAKVREVDLVEDTPNENTMSWQMVFYTLQGAYLCGLFVQMLNEKSNKGKPRNMLSWWSFSSKDLIKVD